MTQTNPYIERTDAFMAQIVAPGVEVYRVGGSVRDEILDRYIKDADYVVRGLSLDALGGALRDALSFGSVTPLKLRDGRQAGWRVSGKGLGLIEITLPRKEVSTGPKHGDFEIVLDPELSLREDAKRRDFTFNALYKVVGATEPSEARISMALMSDSRIVSGIIDPSGRGLYDLEHKLVNVTYATSFRDDPLRTLRALRFVSVLGYDLGSETEALMREHAPAAHGLTAVYRHEAGAVYRDEALEVTATSGTVYEELSKLLMGDNVAKALRLARDTGVLAVVLPELADILGHEAGSRYHDMTTDEHTFLALETAAKAGAPLEVRWALLFHDSGKPETAWVGSDGRMHYYANGETEDHEVAGARRWMTAAQRMNVPKKVRGAVNTIILEHMVTIQPKNAGVKVRRARVRLGDQMLRWVLMHRVCDLAGKGSAKINQRGIQCIGEQERLRQEAQDAGVPVDAKGLQINGHDIIERHGKGRHVGQILAAVLDEVVCDPTEQKLTRDWQLSAAKRAAVKVAA